MADESNITNWIAMFIVSAILWWMVWLMLTVWIG